jgi:quercetin dioxygenase-like cupin family protein
MEKKAHDFVDHALYRGERGTFTADDVVELHARITEKPVIHLEEVELMPAYGLDGCRKGVLDFPNSIVSWGVTEIDPGVESPPHWQLHEATLFILQGKGYSLVDGRRFDWGEGDVVFAPLFSWHQNGNDGREKVRYVTAGRSHFSGTSGSTGRASRWSRDLPRWSDWPASFRKGL